MNLIPARPRLYHILHLDRLVSVLNDGGLWCDAVMQHRTNRGTTIGLQTIKQRRLRLPVRCHPGCSVGDFVPFYFGPRSVMLYLIFKANHAELTYRGGQQPIVHLEADLQRTVAWADSQQLRWAFTRSNAGAAYTEFRNSLEHLADVNWAAVRARDFRSAEIREGKQAEFLVERFFSWHLIERIVVYSSNIAHQVAAVMQAHDHQPPVVVRREWYF